MVAFTAAPKYHWKRASAQPEQSIPTLSFNIRQGRPYLKAGASLPFRAERPKEEEMPGCLIVVDYQNDFVSGSLGFPRAAEIGSAIAARIQKARASGEDVVFTLDTHGPDYLDSHEGKKLPVVHCLRGSEGWQIASPVASEVRDEDLRFEKETFGSDGLYQHLRQADYDRVELCGLVSDICVAANAALARTALPEADIIVDAALTAAADENSFRSALDTLRSLHIDVQEAVE